MSIAQNVAEILRDRVTLAVESIDRLYLNVYVARLQRPLGVVGFFKYYRGYKFVSSALMDPLTKGFVREITAFAKTRGIPVIKFERGQRKDEIAAQYRASFTAQEGVLFLGKAQEKVSAFRTERRQHPVTGVRYPWIVKSTALVNQYYWYCLDADFGPFFLKFSSYFPYNAKLCLNGHEYAKRQLEKEGLGYEALDNGFLTCEEPQRLPALCDGLSAEHLDRLARKWLSLLPNPYTEEDRAAGYDYDVSILQAEFSLTQILDRPLTGRLLCEQLMRENLDLGRPSQVQLIFNRRVTKRTPGQFRTRVLTQGVTPSLQVDYKTSGIKQYHKENRGLRTETTINNLELCEFAATAGSANGCSIFPHSGRSASKPTDACCASKQSATIARSAKPRSKRFNGPRSSRVNEPPVSGSVRPGYRRCCIRWSCSVTFPAGSPIATFVPHWHNCWESHSAR